MLRLEIDGRWDPEDFIDVLKGIESLYYKASLTRRHVSRPIPYWIDQSGLLSLPLTRSLDYFNDGLLTWARTIAPAHLRLEVVRIEYASPGDIDLRGVGEACRAVEGIVDKLIKFFTERELRKERDKQAKLDTKIKEVGVDKEHESLRALKLENARRLLEIHRDFPEVPDELFLALAVNDQDKIIPRIAEGKLVGVRRDGDESLD